MWYKEKCRELAHGVGAMGAWGKGYAEQVGVGGMQGRGHTRVRGAQGKRVPGARESMEKEIHRVS